MASLETYPSEACGTGHGRGSTGYDVAPRSSSGRPPHAPRSSLAAHRRRYAAMHAAMRAAWSASPGAVVRRLPDPRAAPTTMRAGGALS